MSSHRILDALSRRSAESTVRIKESRIYHKQVEDEKAAQAPDVAPRKNTHLSNADNVYYNVRVTNETPDTDKPIVFYENRVSPLLEHPVDYEVAVERFKISTLDLPIFIWDTQPPLYVTLEYKGANYEKQLTFINTGLNSPYGQAIWHYQDFLDIINLQLSAAFTDMKTAFPAAAPTEAPFFAFDATTELLILYAEQAYADAVNGVQIYVNEPLYYFFPCFQVFALRLINKYFQLVINNNILTNRVTFNGKPYLRISGEYTVLALWNDVQTITFESNNILIVPENQPSALNVTTMLITDFEPLDSIQNHTAYQFYPQGPLRYYSLTSSSPLRAIDVRVYWQDRHGNSYPIYLSLGEHMTLKILFRKKSAKQFEDTFGTTLSISDQA